MHPFGSILTWGLDKWKPNENHPWKWYLNGTFDWGKVYPRKRKWFSSMNLKIHVGLHIYLRKSLQSKSSFLRNHSPPMWFDFFSPPLILVSLHRYAPIWPKSFPMIFLAEEIENWGTWDILTVTKSVLNGHGLRWYETSIENFRKHYDQKQWNCWS